MMLTLPSAACAGGGYLAEVARSAGEVTDKAWRQQSANPICLCPSIKDVDAGYSLFV